MKNILIILLVQTLSIFVYSQEVEQINILQAIPALVGAMSKSGIISDKKIEKNKLDHPKLVSGGEYNNCVKFTCEKLGTFGCDSDYELLRVKNICHNQDNIMCLNYICDELGTFGCDSFQEMEGIVNSCKGVRDSSCVNYICQKLGSFSCDSSFELMNVAKVCKNTKTECLRTSCNESGTFSCDDLHEVEQKSQACKENSQKVPG